MARDALRRREWERKKGRGRENKNYLGAAKSAAVRNEPSAQVRPPAGALLRVLILAQGQRSSRVKHNWKSFLR